MPTISNSVAIYDRFSGTLNKLDAGLNKSKSAFNGFKKTAEQSNSVGSSGMLKSIVGGTLIGSGISKGMGLATAGISSMVGELNSSSKAWQTFEGNMHQLGQSPKQIAAAKSDMQQFAQKTIYSASDMASTYSQLAAVGIKDTGKLVRGFGGLAAASENPTQAMKTLSTQATQMAAKPMVQWQDFKLMLEQTPAGVAAVAKTMGMSTKDLVKSVQDGSVATEKFFDAIRKTGTNANFSKMATQFKTVDQAVDGLKESVAIKLQSSFDKFSKQGIKAVTAVGSAIDKINFDTIIQTAISFASKVKNILSQVFDGFKSSGALTSISSMFKDIGENVGKLMGKASSGKSNIFTTLGKLSGAALSGVAKSISALSDVIGDLNPKTLIALGTAFVALKKGTQGLTFTAAIALMNMINKMRPGTIKNVAGSLKNLALAMAAFKIGSGVLGGIKTLTSGLGKLSKYSGKKMKMPSFGKTKTPSIPEMPEPPKTSKLLAGAKAYMQLGAALALVGAGVALAGAGMMLMSKAATSLADSGGAAIATFFGMIAAIGALAVLVKFLGPAMISGSVGFAIFAAALLVIGVATFIAAAGLSLLATQLPIISAYGTSAAVGLLALAGAMLLFGLAAIVGAVGLIALGVSLAIIGVGFLVGAVGAALFGAALLIVGVGALIAGVGLMIVAVALTLVAVFVMIAAVGMLLMAVGLVMIAAVAMIAGLGLMIFAMALMIAAPLMMIAAVGALLLGAAAIVLGAGLLIVGAALILVAAGLTAAASGVITLATAFITAGTMMVSAIVGAMSQVVSAVSNGIQSAVNAAKGFGSALVSVGRDLIQGLVNGIKSMIGSAVQAVSSVASKVVSTAKSILHIGSPSKLFNQYGRWVDQGLAIGLNRDAGVASDASSRMAQGVVDAASGMSPQLQPIGLNGLSGTNPGDLLANGFNRAASAVNEVIGAMSNLDGTTAGVGINGEVSNEPSSSVFGAGTGAYVSNSNYSNTSNDGGNKHVEIQSGAIQINSSGNADYDAETLVTEMEKYILKLDQGQLGG